MNDHGCVRYPRGIRIIGFRDDAGVTADAHALANAVSERFGKVDGVLLNAGLGIFVAHTDVTAEQYDQKYAVNVRGPILHAKLFRSDPYIHEAMPRSISGGNSQRSPLRLMTKLLNL